ncbi:MAG: hypothetical protein A3F91_09930 [Flavobacteria bacterium RIFCSPLOWO2_12_FULL_35_11]|nr:MAG: hypothetical protein A3F91_09930 [Flavobacteria bacterium RIFCSPLOWO2_12_FULL_35_11]
MFKFLLPSLFLVSSLLANYQYTFSKETIISDFEKQDVEKYKRDTLPLFTQKELVQKQVFNQSQALERSYAGSGFMFESIVAARTCQEIGPIYTGTIYSINPLSGEVVCMFALKNDLYNPIGLFKVFYPEIKNHYALDKKTAAVDNAEIISVADAQFRPLLTAKTVASQASATAASEGGRLSITQIIMASILTDADIIDITATAASGKLQLKNSYTSKVTDSEGGTVVDNMDYILTDAETIFDVYGKLSAVSMTYLLLLIVFFGVWGIGRAVLNPLAEKGEGKQSSDKHIPYIFGIVLGVLLFFPVNDHDSIQDGAGETVGQYEIMKTRYQDFEKAGYYLFSEWANASAKAIIDAEVDAIVDKSGVGTKEQIISSAALISQNTKLDAFYRAYQTACVMNVYNIQELVNVDSKTIYSGTQNALFPLSENWAYASSWGALGGKDYYDPTPGGLVLPSGYPAGGGAGIYPIVAFSSCGKVNAELSNVEEQKKNFVSNISKLTNPDGNSGKINMIKTIVDFQYELYRDWGFLAILGLPVTKMQTEYIGGLYNTRNDEVKEKLEKQMTEGDLGIPGADGSIMHTIMSSIPYMFVPGAGTVFKTSLDAANGIRNGVDSSLPGWLGGKLGAGVATSIAATAGGMAIGYQVAKTMLELSPIVGIVIIGLVRFIVIMIKIFSFHFASLFLMPIMFARENIKALSNFTMKIFATMMELPIFVLAVWLAITANSLIHSVGDVFSKKIIIGMLENNEAQYAGVATNYVGYNGAWLAKLKIYVFDGVMEIAIAVFSVIIIYKLIITLHNTLFEVLEIQGSQSLDNSIESMKNEAGGWGSRI